MSAVRFLFTDRLVNEMPDTLITELEQFLKDDLDFELRTTATLYNTYDVVDEKNICVYVANPFDQNSILGTVQVNDKSIVRFIQDQWQPQWEAASGI